MFLTLVSIIKNMVFFTGSYGNNVFPEPLKDEEEKKYIDLMFKGDKNARSILIEHNLRLVAHIVKKFDSKLTDTDDLISIGTIGLIKGIDTYKKNDKVKITTYAARCIQNEILMFYRSNKKNQFTISLNDSIGYDKEGNEINLEDLIEDRKEDILDTIEIQENINLLKEYLRILNKREKEIIIKRYGLNNEKELTQKEIADKMNISRSYVSRIEKRALIKILREFIKHKKINR
jgi:RNA polymerase sporulation-specific sigma factor